MGLAGSHFAKGGHVLGMNFSVVDLLYPVSATEIVTLEWVVASTSAAPHRMGGSVLELEGSRWTAAASVLPSSADLAARAQFVDLRTPSAHHARTLVVEGPSRDHDHQRHVEVGLSAAFSSHDGVGSSRSWPALNASLHCRPWSEMWPDKCASFVRRQLTCAAVLTRDPAGFNLSARKSSSARCTAVLCRRCR